MEFEVGKLYYIPWGLNDSGSDNRPNPNEIWGIGIFTHIQISRGEKSYNFSPCMTLSGNPADRKYCIGEIYNLNANKTSVTQAYRDSFYRLYPNLKKDSMLDLPSILKPTLTTSYIVEFIQNLETENKKLKEENKNLKDLINNTGNLLEQISDLYERYQPANK